ncbi:hypothetical protein [Rhizohabitans arisaemae]|nr:hypothetical protein [Rhizohabitans arisaemae]
MTDTTDVIEAHLDRLRPIVCDVATTVPRRAVTTVRGSATAVS